MKGINAYKCFFKYNIKSFCVFKLFTANDVNET